MTLSAFLLMVGIGTASADGYSQESFEPAQSKTRITGTVVDTNNEPIIGTNVVEKGTTNGISTDANGAFGTDRRQRRHAGSILYRLH